MKSIAWSVSTKELAQWLTIITLLGVVPVASLAAESPRGCDPGAAAAAYDRKADEYEAAADERYRAWARGRVAGDQVFDGKTETVKDNKRANELLTREYRKGFEVPKSFPSPKETSQQASKGE